MYWMGTHTKEVSYFYFGTRWFLRGPSGRRGGVDSIHACNAQLCLTRCNPTDCSPPGSPLSLGFPRQEYWSRLPFPTQGDLPDPEIEPESPVAHALPGGFFTTESPGKPVDSVVVQSLSCVQFFSPPWNAGFPVLHHLLQFAQTHVHWGCATISSSVIPFSSCPQFSPASGSLPMSWLFASGGQSIGASTSASVLPMNIQAWFPLGLTG